MISTVILAVALVTQAPKSAGTLAAPSERYQAEIKKTLEQRRERRITTNQRLAAQ